MPRKNKLKKQCFNCNKEYETFDSRRIYCSRSCASVVSNSEKKKKGRRVYKYICPNCEEEFKTQDKRKKFCGRACAASFNNKGRVLTDEHKKKVSKSLKKHYKNNPGRNVPYEQSVQHGANSQKGKHKKPESIWDLSKRTVSKIFKRLDIGCSVCGWKEESCDVHHINGRKIKDPHNHKNLTYVCPNHHRLAQRGKIAKKSLITLDIYIGDEWKKYYYG